MSDLVENHDYRSFRDEIQMHVALNQTKHVKLIKEAEKNRYMKTNIQ